jgi:hypothetical protein
LIKGKSARSIYFLDKGVRRPVGGMDIMEARNFTLAQVRGRLGRGEGTVATCAAAARIPPPHPHPHPSSVSLATAAPRVCRLFTSVTWSSTRSPRARS